MESPAPSTTQETQITVSVPADRVAAFATVKVAYGSVDRPRLADRPSADAIGEFSSLFARFLAGPSARGRGGRRGFGHHDHHGRHGHGGCRGGHARREQGPEGAEVAL